MSQPRHSIAPDAPMLPGTVPADIPPALPAEPTAPGPRLSPAGGFARFLQVALVTLGLAMLWVFTASPDDYGLLLWRTYRVPVILLNLVLTYVALVAIFIVTGANQRRRLLASAACTFSLAGLWAAAELPAVLLGFNYEVVLGTGGSSMLHAANAADLSHPELLHIHRPLGLFEGQVTGNLTELGIPHPQRYSVNVRYDANGFRNDATPQRVEFVAIGDSFVEAALIPADSTVVSLIGRQTGRPAANLGQINYGLEQELFVLRKFGLPLQPRVVLWFFFEGNDLRDVDGYERACAARARLERRPLRHRLFCRNLLIALSDRTTPPRRRPARAAADRSAQFVRADGTTETVYFGQTDPLWTPHQWEVMTGTLLEARDLCREHGARLLVVYIPRKFRVYREHLRAPGALVAGWSVNDLPTAMADWCRANQIPLIDTTPHLEALVAAGVAPYFPDDVHWNTTGHAAAANLIASFLQQEDWLNSEAAFHLTALNRPERPATDASTAGPHRPADRSPP